MCLVARKADLSRLIITSYLTGVTDLDIKAFTPSHVRDDPLIHTGGAIHSVKANLSGQMRGSFLSLNNPPMIKEYYVDKGGLLMRYL